MRYRSTKKGMMVVKIDLDKAYDQLNWSFIELTLRVAQIPDSLDSTIMDCITSSEMAFLWNGSKTDTFKPTRGIRQGDLLSPYIFVIFMERLSQIIDYSVTQGDWKPITAC